MEPKSGQIIHGASGAEYIVDSLCQIQPGEADGVYFLKASGGPTGGGGIWVEEVNDGWEILLHEDDFPMSVLLFLDELSKMRDLQFFNEFLKEC